ncbi:MAG TPA: DUF481 domain-containing protein [Steroidobacteraceae bacterium]|jgi:putative salt-induced outer membrane protein
MCKQVGLFLLASVALCSTAHADDANGWASRAQLGYAKTSGNTDSSTGNALFHIARAFDPWKVLFGLEGLYGSTKGETTAQAWDTYLQAHYSFTDRLYGYGGVRYDDNRFSGFAYQEALTTGAGYQFVKTDATKLSAQIGVGARHLRPEILTEDAVGGIISAQELDAATDAVIDGGVNLEHAFNQYTKLIGAVAVESGRQNTMTTAGISLQVKMSNVLSLAAGYQLVRNSQPPPGAGPTNSNTTLNLVYELANKNLAPQ